MRFLCIFSLVFLLVCFLDTEARKIKSPKSNKNSAKIKTKNKKFTTLKASSSKQVKVVKIRTWEDKDTKGKQPDCVNPDDEGCNGEATNPGNTNGCTTQQVCETVYVPRVGYRKVCKMVSVCSATDPDNNNQM